MASGLLQLPETNQPIHCSEHTAADQQITPHPDKHFVYGGSDCYCTIQAHVSATDLYWHVYHAERHGQDPHTEVHGAAVQKLGIS